MPPAKPHPVVFISHSSRGDPRAAKILTAVNKALTRAGFEVLIDMKGLKGGDVWRDRLHTWMSHCHATILLLSKKALKSDWVLQEATILTSRRFQQGQGDSVDLQFPLLPVLVDISMKDIARSSAFTELALPRIQTLHKGTPAQISREVVQLLLPLKKSLTDTPRRDLERKIASNLRAAGAPVLNAATARLRAHPAPWVPTRDAADILATRLLEARFDRIPAALQTLTGAVPTERLREVVNILGSVWVKPEAAARFATVSRGPARGRATVLNARLTEFTSKSYVARAGGPAAVEIMIPIAPGGGEDYYGSIVGQIKEHFLTRRGTDDLDRIRALVTKVVGYAPLVIVVPPPLAREPLIDDTDIRELLKTFELCTLLVLTGPQQPSDGVLPGIRRLSPPLAATEEDEAWTWHTTCQMVTGT